MPTPRAIIRHIEAGGVRILLYGGNANLYHFGLDDYRAGMEAVIAALHADRSRHVDRSGLRQGPGAGADRPRSGFQERDAAPDAVSGRFRRCRQWRAAASRRSLAMAWCSI